MPTILILLNNHNHTKTKQTNTKNKTKSSYDYGRHIQILHKSRSLETFAEPLSRTLHLFDTTAPLLLTLILSLPLSRVCCASGTIGRREPLHRLKMRVSENRGPEYNTLNSRILIIIRAPKIRYPEFSETLIIEPFKGTLIVPL